MHRSRIQAQYARHPQESLSRLASRLASKKWSMADIAREDAAHSDEYGVTNDDKEYLDRYIIARIAESYDKKKAVAKQKVLRRAWEIRHKGESFDAALPSRMARFRQYEDVPFGVYGNAIERQRYDHDAGSDEDSAWSRYLSKRAEADGDGDGGIDVNAIMKKLLVKRIKEKYGLDISGRKPRSDKYPVLAQCASYMIERNKKKRRTADDGMA